MLLLPLVSPQVAERSLFLWNHEYIITLVAQYRQAVLPIVFGALEENAANHWNPAVHGLTCNVRKMFMVRRLLGATGLFGVIWAAVSVITAGTALAAAVRGVQPFWLPTSAAKLSAKLMRDQQRLKHCGGCCTPAAS